MAIEKIILKLGLRNSVMNNIPSSKLRVLPGMKAKTNQYIVENIIILNSLVRVKLKCLKE